ncbi:response regulator transcription factor [Microbacterium sp. NPDC090007]|uniref:response regulator transcription factor n=1 Tax=Microbacterium sp. NPDC090007 TaxID=3364204 RepID=UPI0037FE1010
MSSPARVLVLDDDETIRLAVTTALRADGFVAEAAPDGTDLTERLGAFRPDLVILDWMMPGPHGIRLLPVVREAGDAAVIMLTARDDVEDRLRGFAEGADDYVVKPFTMAELVARSGAVLRRRGRLPQTISVGDLVVDPDAATARRGGATLDLTATEFRLLQLLAEGRGRTLSKAQILTQVWGYEDYDPNLVEVHLSALRRKMEHNGPRLIHTVRGLGYRLSVAP